MNWPAPRKNWSGVYVRFQAYPKPLRISYAADDEIERARKHAEAKLGRPLPRCRKTNYPAFTLYCDGEEVEEETCENEACLAKAVQTLFDMPYRKAAD